MTKAGNREYGMGHEVTVEYDDSTDSEAGDAVYVSGHSGSHPRVQLADDTNGVDGVVEEAVTDGDHVNMHLQGPVWTRVADGDDVSAGNTVGTDTGMVDGELTSSGSDYLALEGEVDYGGTKYALVVVDN